MGEPSMQWWLEGGTMDWLLWVTALYSLFAVSHELHAPIKLWLSDFSYRRLRTLLRLAREWQCWKRDTYWGEPQWLRRLYPVSSLPTSFSDHLIALYPGHLGTRLGGVTPISQLQPHSVKVNGQTTWIDAVNGQSGVKKTVNMQITVLSFAPNLLGGVTHAWSTYFLAYRLADSGYSSNIERANYPSGQRSMAKPLKRTSQCFDPRSQL